jgi:DNA-binding LacI/PurR family transcriptional regulator
MSSQPGVLDLPRRLSLSAQTAAAIRKAVAERMWEEYLPSERRLCELFQVSRPTVRAALRQLAKSGLIEIHQGRRNRLLAGGVDPAPARNRLVVLVARQPLAHMTLTAYRGISEMRAHLAEHGFGTEVLVCAARSAAAQRRKIEAFLRQNRVFCCVLLSLGPELQEWFAAGPTPALVLGSCHPDVRLPSLDVDYRSVCRHAAGVLRAQGHRRIAFLVPDANAAGDLASETGFREGLPGGGGLVVRHPGTAAGLAAKLDALFAQPQPPTALLVAKPAHVFSVVMHLLKRGIKVPDTLSLVARDHDHLFENGISHYRFEGETFAHRLSRLMLQMVNQGFLPPEPSLIFPRYVAAGTVRRPPA